MNELHDWEDETTVELLTARKFWSLARVFKGADRNAQAYDWAVTRHRLTGRTYRVQQRVTVAVVRS